MASVWYVGDSQVRRVGDWFEIGVSDATAAQDRVAVWGPDNGWSIDQASFSKQQLAWLNGQDEFYVGAPGGARSVAQGPGDGRVRVVGKSVYGPGVVAVPDSTVSSGVVYLVNAPGVRAVRDPSVASGYTYLIEET